MHYAPFQSQNVEMIRQNTVVLTRRRTFAMTPALGAVLKVHQTAGLVEFSLQYTRIFNSNSTLKCTCSHMHNGS